MSAKERGTRTPGVIATILVTVVVAAIATVIIASTWPWARMTLRWGRRCRFRIVVVDYKVVKVIPCPAAPLSEDSAAWKRGQLNTSSVDTVAIP